MTPDWSGASERRFSLLVNPFAGGGGAHEAADIVERRLHEAGVGVKMLAATSPEQMLEWAQEAVLDAQRSVEQGVPHGVVAVGGDGTVHVVVQAVAETGVPFGVVASGSGDDAARAWGLPRSQPEASAEILLTGVPVPMDLGVATGADGTRHGWATVVATGFDAKVSERAHRLQRVPPLVRYVVAVAVELSELRPLHYRVTVDGQTRELDGMLVAVANAASFGGGMAVCPNAVADDGVLDVFVLDPLPRRQFLRVFPKVYRGAHVGHPAVHIFRAREVTVEADDVVAYVDGERLGPLPQTMTLVPGGLQVIGARSTMVL